MQLKLIYEQYGPELQAENKQTNKQTFHRELDFIVIIINLLFGPYK